jgi:hypothetical protein
MDHPALTAWDKQLTGPGGARLRALVERTALQVGIDPGLLAVNALHEDTAGSQYVDNKRLLNTVIGVDYWHTMQHAIKAAVPLAKTIRAIPLTPSRAQQLGVTTDYINEQGQNAGPRYEFADGPNALLAVASALKYFESDLRKTVGDDVWARIPAGEQFALLRVAYNKGLDDARKLVKTAAAGTSILVPTGRLFYTDAQGRPDPNRFHPRRHATQAAGQAIHLSQTLFGKSFATPLSL